eukprot:TRINITY_DN13709_c0_g1_i2.p1 TRINITY_DN13709_c0_g1~~TRINITY_DN13709_c0_g1_i2.p1  ORF type:complete len:151 (+),score=43.83 TRINITY_DN13709_c0_g1_i2:161-613(+)
MCIRDRSKCTFSLIAGEYDNDKLQGVFTTPMLYIVASLLVCTYLMQIKLTMQGLEECSAIIVMCVQSVTEEFFAVMGGLLWFQDYKDFVIWGVVLFVIGQVLAMSSVVVLSYFRLERAEDAANLRASDRVLSESDEKLGDPKDKAWFHSE